MSCSYSTLEDAWETPRDRYRSSRKTRREISPSPSPSTSSDGANTLVIGTDEGYESSVPGKRDVIISRSPSESQSTGSMVDSQPVVTSGRGSPVSFLDEDDYVSDSGNSAMMSRSVSPSPSIPNDLPGLPPGSNPPQQRPPRTSPASYKGNTTDKKMMRQILRIRDDVREMLQVNGTKSTTNENVLQSFPFVETGLFIAIGLFVLLAMQMMIRIRPSPGIHTGFGTTASDMIKNIRLVE